MRWEASGDPIAGSDELGAAGNGSLMRFAPVVLRYWTDPAKKEEVASAPEQSHAFCDRSGGCLPRLCATVSGGY